MIKQLTKIFTVMVFATALYADETAVTLDHSIQENVKAEMAWSPEINSDEVIVRVDDAEVSLSGTVDSYYEKITAGNEAWSVTGVVDVDNNLKVDYSKSLADAAIQDSILNQLIWNSAVEAEDITVHVVNGIVTLNGTVDSYWQKVRAEEISERIYGVISIDNRLAVVPTDDFSDERIADRINSTIADNYRVEADNVTVKVKDGKVTLSGEVDDYLAKTAAEDAAIFTRGVRVIVNNIEIGTDSAS